MQETTLTICLQGFSVERALSKYSLSHGKTFREYISDQSGNLSAERLCECINPVMDFSALNADPSPFPSEYMEEEGYPTATAVRVSNVIPNEDDETVSFDVEFVFSGFQVTNQEDALESLQMSEEEIAIYMLQMKADILRSFGLRNNRFSVPKVVMSLHVT